LNAKKLWTGFVGCGEIGIMKIQSAQVLLCLALVSLLSSPAFAREKMTDRKAIQICLENWNEHPFKDKNPKFRTLDTKVKIFGGGKIVDHGKTSAPELILVKPGANVLSQVTLKLMNSKGWYCFRSNTTVLSDSTIEVACDAHIESASESKAILGSNRGDQGGVTVLGKTKIVRVGCAK
jgi:hypothetical protein